MTLDAILGMVLFFSGLLAFVRGFVHEVLSLVAWVGAALAAMHGLQYARPMARDVIPVAWVADAAALTVIFLVVLLALSMITKAVSGMVHSTIFGSLDRSLGFVFGVVRGGLLVSLGYLLVDSLVLPQDRPAWLNDARSLPLMESGASAIRSVIPKDLQGQARATANQATERAREALEAERTFRQLTQPQPASPAETARPEGYNNHQRRDMDRLFNSTQQ